MEHKKLFVKRSKINGNGLFTYQSFKKNDFVGYVKGPKVRVKKFTPTLSQISMNWFGVSKEIWINPGNSEFNFINHSCDPNCALITTRKVVAIKSINAGDELTIDYSLNESDEGWRIDNCRCGAKNCRKTIRPIQFLSRTEFTQKKNFIQKTFQNIYLKNYPHIYKK